MPASPSTPTPPPPPPPPSTSRPALSAEGLKLRAKADGYLARLDNGAGVTVEDLCSPFMSELDVASYYDKLTRGVERSTVNRAISEGKALTAALATYSE